MGLRHKVFQDHELECITSMEALLKVNHDDSMYVGLVLAGPTHRFKVGRDFTLHALEYHEGRKVVVAEARQLCLGNAIRCFYVDIEDHGRVNLNGTWFDVCCMPETAQQVFEYAMNNGMKYEPPVVRAPQPTPITLEMIRHKLRDVRTKCGIDVARDILYDYGASMTSRLDPKSFGAVYSTCNAVLGVEADEDDGDDDDGPTPYGKVAKVKVKTKLKAKEVPPPTLKRKPVAALATKMTATLLDIEKGLTPPKWKHAHTPTLTIPRLQELVALANKFFPSGTFIAGGCLRDLLHGKPYKDIDLWTCEPAAQFDGEDWWACVQKFAAALHCEKPTVRELVDGTSYARGVLSIADMTSGWHMVPVQVINYEDDCTPFEMISGFDYGLCQIGLNERRLFTTQAYNRDHDLHRITLINPPATKGRADRARTRHQQLRERYVGWDFRGAHLLESPTVVEVITTEIS